MLKAPIRLEKWAILIANGIASLVADDPLGCAFRRLIYRVVGIRIVGRPSVFGGQMINGRNLLIEPGCFINRSCYFDLTGHVHIGKGAVIGHGVTFVTAVHEMGPPERRSGPVTAGKIFVGDGAWIAANVTVLPNVTIGKGSIIAAGSVVNRDVPENSLYGGVPAQHIRDLTN